jgi:hypothetical protein
MTFGSSPRVDDYPGQRRDPRDVYPESSLNLPVVSFEFARGEPRRTTVLTHAAMTVCARNQFDAAS